MQESLRQEVSLSLDESMVHISFYKGNLALSRALGDFEFKVNENIKAEDQIVTADPEIIEHAYNPEDEFMVIACDGIPFYYYRNLGLHDEPRCG